MSRIEAERERTVLDPVVEALPAFELCFLPMADSCVRIRGGKHGLYNVVRQITYRCGMCYQPVAEQELNTHYDGHHNDAIRGMR